MNRKRILTALIATAAGCAMAGAGAADRVDVGQREYDGNCAACHGVKGKGDGPAKPFLTRSPTDLTTLARANGGVFPLVRVYETVDGRATVAAHGPRDMPIWGRDYSVRAAEHYMDVPYDADAVVRARILALCDYLNRLQAK